MSTRHKTLQAPCSPTAVQLCGTAKLLLGGKYMPRPSTLLIPRSYDAPVPCMRLYKQCQSLTGSRTIRSLNLAPYARTSRLHTYIGYHNAGGARTQLPSNVYCADGHNWACPPGRPTRFCMWPFPVPPTVPPAAHHARKSTCCHSRATPAAVEPEPGSGGARCWGVMGCLLGQ